MAKFTGTADDDTIVGSNTPDTIDGGAGNDTLYGYGDGSGVGGTPPAIDPAGGGADDRDSLLGGLGADVLYAGAGADTLDGGLGADTVDGGHGDDFYRVDQSDDQAVETEIGAAGGIDTVESKATYALGANVENLTLVGAALNGFGNDRDNRIIGNAAANILTGEIGEDRLEGGAGNDTLDGGDSDDLLDGGAGADVLVGGDGVGIDSYIIDNVGDVIIETDTSENDKVTSTMAVDLTKASFAGIEHATLVGKAGLALIGDENANALTGNAGANRIEGGGGDDTLEGDAGNDTLVGGDGVDHYFGGAGNDLYLIDPADFPIVEDFDAGIDTVQTALSHTLLANIENLILTAGGGGTGNELANRIVNTGKASDANLLGLAGNDTLVGSDGSDQLDGGEGADSMAGGDGADFYLVDNAGDKVAESGKVTSDADGDLLDTVATTLTSYTLGANLETLVMTGDVGSTGKGNSLHNRIVGTAKGDLLQGMAGNDLLYGEDGSPGGDDTLDGGAGNDSLTGGEGNDLFLGGAGDDTIDGDGDAGGFTDTMRGGAGNDVYFLFDAGKDVVEELANQGIDTVFASFDYALADNVENLTLETAADLDGTGNDLGNAITGNSGANSLSGGLGNDTLDGGDDDKADTLNGGGGNDTYIWRGGTADVIQDAAGIDTVVSGVSLALAADLENLTLIGAALMGTGNDLANRILGGAGSDTLIGGKGTDTLEGGDGNDDLFGSFNDFPSTPDGVGELLMGGEGNDDYVITELADKIVETGSTKNGSDDHDQVFAFLTSYTLGANVEDLRLRGVGNSTGTGNTLNNFVEGTAADDTLLGMAGNDSLVGGDGADSLDGGAGDDTLNGSTGDDVDVLKGGAGNDRYVIPDDSLDTIVEMKNQGTDTVVIGTDFVLGDHLENLELTGTANFSGTGNAVNNAITGNSGANSLAGGLGNDTLDGGGSDGVSDKLNGGEGNDTYVLYAAGGGDAIQDSGGIDTVVSDGTYTFVAGLENLVLTGSGTGTGNELANRITNSDKTIGASLVGLVGNDTLVGSDGDDDLNGGTGADSMAGGEGADHYVVDDAGDKVAESGKITGVGDGDSSDSVSTSLLSYTLGATLEDLILFGAAGSTGKGNSSSNDIFGTDFGDVLLGLGGNDNLRGQDGDDTLDGGDGNDRLFGEAGQDSLVGGAGDDDLDGGAGADVLKGGAGNDEYAIADAADTIVELANQGIDWVVAGVDFVLGDNLENLKLLGAAVSGTGNALANEIDGNTNANSLTGGLGNDTLDGGANDGTADTLNGGDGNDTYFIYDDGVADIIQDSGGIDTVATFGASHTLAGGLENLQFVEVEAANGTGNGLANRISGGFGASFFFGLDGNDTLEGHGGTDQLRGGEGDDSLVGGEGDDLMFADAGADTMVGGAGDDSYFLYGTAQKVVETKGQGTDTVFIVEGIADYTMPTEIEYLDFSESTGNVNALGNALANKMTGNFGANRIDGAAGDDTLVGNAGNDTLTGGAGADSMNGGLGDDLYFVDNLGDVVSDSGGDADEVRSSVALAAAIAGIEHYTFTGTTAVDFTGDDASNRIAGTAKNDTLRGGDGNDTLDGGAGADVLISEQGNDTYIIDNVGDRIIDLGDGIDTVQSTMAVDLTLAKFDGIEHATLLGTKGLSLTGDELDNFLIGNTGANKISGGIGGDELAGESGNDTLDGGEGGDDLGGGEGNDSIVGGAGDDVMAGDAGADTLVGGAGQDTYRYNAGDLLGVADVILGFGVGGADQDFVNLDEVLDKLGVADADRAAKVSFVDTGADVELRLDTDGNGSFDWTVLTFQGVADAAVLSAGTAPTDDIQVGTL
jgi:Ca2+-binding RTX toxin-like protein